MLVLDSSAFFSIDALPEEDHVCPPGVIKELQKYEDPRLALWGDMVHVSDCSQESLRKVEEVAKKSGDLGRLSPVDMTVLALALDVNGTIWSDDYSIQNVAKIMGIGFKPIGMKGIEKVVKWNYKCIGCGRQQSMSLQSVEYDSATKQQQCVYIADSLCFRVETNTTF